MPRVGLAAERNRLRSLHFSPVPWPTIIVNYFITVFDSYIILSSVLQPLMHSFPWDGPQQEDWSPFHGSLSSSWYGSYFPLQALLPTSQLATLQLFLKHMLWVPGVCTPFSLASRPLHASLWNAYSPSPFPGQCSLSALSLNITILGSLPWLPHALSWGPLLLPW